MAILGTRDSTISSSAVSHTAIVTPSRDIHLTGFACPDPKTQETYSSKAYGKHVLDSTRPDEKLCLPTEGPLASIIRPLTSIIRPFAGCIS